jgi:hypothetical protein
MSGINPRDIIALTMPTGDRTLTLEDLKEETLPFYLAL